MGKKSGRGAYLCARLSCWENAVKKKLPEKKRLEQDFGPTLLEQEFELTLSEEDRAGLDAYIATLPKDEPVQPPAQRRRVQQSS